MMNKYQQAAEWIKNCGRIFVFSHLNPDGDSVASMSACVLALRKMGKEVYAYQPEGIPLPYQFLTQGGIFRSEIPSHREFDLLLALDTADAKRIPEQIRDWVFSWKDGERWEVPFLNIDHHYGNTGYGSVNIVDTHASSTAELLHRILLEIPVELTEEIACALYAGYLMDTGGFAFSNTKPETLRLAASLLEAGVQPDKLYRQLFLNHSLPHLNLLGQVLVRLRMIPEVSLVWSYADIEDFQRLGAKNGDIEGIPEFLMRTQEARMAILFIRLPEDPERVRVSFRSWDSADVNEFAQRFGGGGHRASSGARIRGVLSEVIDRVLSEACDFLRNRPQ